MLEVQPPAAGFDRPAALSAVRGGGLEALFQELTPGPFGLSAAAVGVLEVLLVAVDTGLGAAHALRGLLLESLSHEGGSRSGFQLPQLQVPHQRLISAFQLTVTADEALRLLAEKWPVPAVEGGLGAEGIEELLDETDAAELARRQMTLCAAYIRQRPASEAAESLGSVLAAVAALLRNTVLDFARGGALRPLVAELQRRQISVVGARYDGLVRRSETSEPALLPIRTDQIVGNEEYLRLGMRLARDVAGYDFAAGSNPKRVQPVLFGLGSPGCGKTVTAHAIGGYFLRYCAERQVPARFLVIRRSDWASSYQNASAANLIRIFRQEVHGFEGVSGVYWPDIDTALASRSAAGLRVEEKQNLGAVFGVFDGTLLPKDGKWFMICDANTLHMDDAAISRIAQQPVTVKGPTTAEHCARLMRDLGLNEVAEFLPTDREGWQRIGQKAVELQLSGREIAGLCGRLRAHIQDFEYPDEYFGATSAERQAILQRLSQPVDEAYILEEMTAAAGFRRQAREREESKRFEDDVATAVRQLNASREALERMTEP